jgi:hypothetical protein
VTHEAVAWLAGLDGPSMKRVIENVTWGWSAIDPQTMAAFFSAANPDWVPTYSYGVLARELVRNDPAGALEWANHLPPERALTAGAEAFAEWRSSQPDTAMKWLNDLSSADPRREAYFQGALKSLLYHPQAAEQFALMSPTDRATARTLIQNMQLPEDRRSRLLTLLSR